MNLRVPHFQVEILSPQKLRKLICLLMSILLIASFLPPISLAQEQSEAVAKAIKSQLKSLIQSEIINSKRSGNSLNPTQLQGVF